jgi:polysaccharide biosynthesis protein PslH
MAAPRILIITNRIPFPLNDGGALAMFAMVKGYQGTGWAVSLLSMNTSRHYVSLESLPPLFKKIEFATFDINTDIKLAPILKNFFLSKKPNHAERFHDPAFEKKVISTINSFQPDFIQVESIYLGTYIDTIKKATTATLIIRLHNIEYQIWERLAIEAGNSFKRYYLKDLAGRIRRFELEAWKKADILLPITSKDEETVVSSLPSAKTILVPFGIEIKGFLKPRHQDWVGYHIGAMDWMPNVEGITWFLEAAWPIIHKELPSFTFHFAGRNMPGSFEKYEKNGVVCEGEVENAETFISNKKILIVPIRSGGGMRIKVLEAMAAGKVIVSTSTGIEGIEGAENGVNYLLADTAADFARQIKWILENKPAAETIADQAIGLVRQYYDQSQIIDQLTKSLLQKEKTT